jgi:THO complex subunit 4
MQELMVTTVGQIKVVELAYDSQGKSKGIATVIFRQKGSAQKAFDACTFSSVRLSALGMY